MKKKEDILVSVIIPAYNMEVYLEHSLFMLVSQSHEKLEIILIDDGSEDRTYEIGKQFEKKDNRITCLHKENGGAASARNYGLAVAAGDYITFVDADDCIPVNYIELLVDMATTTNADIAMSGYEKFFGETRKWQSPAFFSQANTILYNSEQALKLLLYRKKLVNSPWPKLIKRNILKNMSFPEGKLYEDLAIIYRLFDKAAFIAYNPAVGYFYLQRSGSSMHSDFRIQKWDLIEITMEQHDFIYQRYPNLKRAADSRLFISSLQMLRELPWEKRYSEQFKFLKKQLKSVRKTVLRDPNNSKSTRILAASAYLPLYLLRGLGKTYDFVINNFKIRLKY